MPKDEYFHYKRQCICGAKGNDVSDYLGDPSHWIFDFLIRVGWITPVPENKVREWQKRGYLAKYGPCCRYGRLTTAIGFPYLIDVGFS